MGHSLGRGSGQRQWLGIVVGIDIIVNAGRVAAAAVAGGARRRRARAPAGVACARFETQECVRAGAGNTIVKKCSFHSQISNE